MTAHPTRRARLAVASLAAVALAAGVSSTTASAAVPTAPAPPVPSSGVHARAVTPGGGPAKAASVSTPRDKLGEHDRGLLATARAKGDRRVTLIVSTVTGQTASVAASVRAEGGFTSTTNDRIGYVRAAVPISSVERIAGLARVLAVDLDESIPLPDPSGPRGPQPRSPRPAPRHRTATRTCRPATPARSPSAPRTRRGTGAT